MQGRYNNKEAKEEKEVVIDWGSETVQLRSDAPFVNLTPQFYEMEIRIQSNVAIYTVYIHMHHLYHLYHLC